MAGKKQTTKPVTGVTQETIKKMDRCEEYTRFILCKTHAMTSSNSYPFDAAVLSSGLHNTRQSIPTKSCL